MSDGTADRQLRERARAVIPGGMYGHQAAPGPAYPQFMRGGRGARVWDADGNEYVDLMCSYGPVVLGHRHPAVEAAAARQAATGDCMNAPGPVMVDLADAVSRVESFGQCTTSDVETVEPIPETSPLEQQ